MSKPAPFIWYDLMTTDMDAASKFYASVIGWNIEDSGMAGQSYSILKTGDRMVGGLMAIPPGGAEGGLTPMWTCYIHSSDVDADAAKAVKLGAKVCRPPDDIPQVGRFAAIADAAGGSMFNLFKPNGEGGGGAADSQPGTVGWRELRAGNGDAAWAFYLEMFGWRKSHGTDMGPMGVYQIFKTDGDQDMGAMMTRQDGQSPGWFFYFNVATLDAAVERLKAAGGKLVNGPMEVPGGQWVAHATDPQGAAFGLVAPKR